MTRRLMLAAVISSTVALAASAPQAQAPKIEPLDSPVTAAGEAPQLTVSDRGILLSWIERSGAQASLKFAERTPTGWSPVKTVASGNDWFVNWADVPSVLRLADGSLVGHWLQKSGASTYAYDVRLARSKDEGKTWTPSVTPHHDGTQTEHGFASMFQVPGAGLGLVWLDGRDTKPAAGGAGHDGHGTGSMTVRYGTFDGTWKQTAEMPIDTRVCECCPTSAAVTSDGLIAAFRNRTDDETRDIYVSRFEKGKWTEPKAVHNDNWQIAACPVNGPMLSARGRDVVISWFTGVDDPGRAYVAFSKDAGRTFSAPIRVDDVATVGRVDVELMPDGSAMATWIELVDKKTEFKVRRIQPSGARGEAVKIADLVNSRTSGYPRVARHGNELLFAWTEVGPATPGARATTRVRTAVAR
jgi:hypothetical protein